MSGTGWTAPHAAAIARDPVLSRLGTDGLDALLVDDELEALRAHLDYLAKLRQRVEAEGRGMALP